MNLIKSKSIAYISLISILIHACSPEKEASKYLRWVGDIAPDEQLDDPNFTLCYGENGPQQYFNFGTGLQYEGEKIALRKIFFDEYQSVSTDQSGLIRIRFIVNCNGETGRFRLSSADLNYQEMEFNKEITSQLMQITKSLTGWKKLPLDKKPRDYYQYLIFKIEKGQLIDVLP